MKSSLFLLFIIAVSIIDANDAPSYIDPNNSNWSKSGKSTTVQSVGTRSTIISVEPNTTASVEPNTTTSVEPSTTTSVYTIKSKDEIDTFVQMVQENGTESTETQKQSELCHDSMAFPTLQDCVNTCALTISTSEHQNPSTNFLFSYKLLFLIPNEDPGTNIGLDIHEHYQWDMDDGHFICYPMPSTFTNCSNHFLFEIEWGSDSNYDPMSKTLHIRLPQFSHDYSIDEFVRESEHGYIVCTEEDDEHTDAYLVAWIVSAIGLLVTIVLASIIPQLNLKQNRILMNHVWMAFFVYVTLIVDVLVEEVTVFLCELFAYARHFFTLAMFFWFSVQAIDIGLRFRSVSAPSAESNVGKNRRTCYLIYGWGTPCIITFITFVIQQIGDTMVHPGLEHCWFKGDKTIMWFYVYCPIIFVMATNFAVFIFLIVKMYKLKQGTSSKNITTQLCIIYCKLMIVTGLLWILDFISWLAGDKVKDWIYVDIVVALQGLFIALVYLCKPILFRMLRVKLVACHNFCLRNTPWKRSFDTEVTPDIPMNNLSMSHTTNNSEVCKT